MFIETRYMRLGNGPTGDTEQNSHHTRHKEEARVEPRQTWLTARACATHLMFTRTDWIMSLIQMVHSIMSIVTWQIAHPKSNADNAVILGHRAMENFKGGWPDSIYFPISKLVVIMDVKKNYFSHLLAWRHTCMVRLRDSSM